MFNETPVNAKKCAYILTKILYLINQGEVLAPREATDCFFAMTKLFQSKDIVMRRMVYLGIKELSSLADDVIIVTSSLTKDMTGKATHLRASDTIFYRMFLISRQRISLSGTSHPSFVQYYRQHNASSS